MLRQFKKESQNCFENTYSESFLTGFEMELSKAGFLQYRYLLSLAK